MSKEFKSWLKLEIPHIRTTVYFADMKYLQTPSGKEESAGGYTCIFGAPIEESGKLELCVFFSDIEDFDEYEGYEAILAHELMHVIQYICQELQFDIKEEKEHTAYLMSHKFESVQNKLKNYGK